MHTMADYLDIVVPDVSSFTLGAGGYAIHPQNVLRDSGEKNQEIHPADDAKSEERIDLGDDEAIMGVTLSWDVLTATESGLLFDIYNDPAKANAMMNSFPWQHPDPDDGHIYVVRFDCSLERERQAYDIYGIMNIKLRVLGYIS